MVVKERISVILPTYNRYHVCKENIENIQKQSYKDFEITICDDSDAVYHKENHADLEKYVKQHKNVKYYYTAMFDKDGKKDYGLARARNQGIIHATGEVLIFLDDRITPATEDVFGKFYAAVKNSKKTWFFGDKGAQKTSFVENFSAMRRSEMVDAGMFCERINKYGGMTRELHGRFTRQDFHFTYMSECTAKQVCKSGGWDRKDKEIPEMRALLAKMFSR